MNPLENLRWRGLAALHFVIGAAALLGGGALVVWPSGNMLGMPVSLLSQSPFTDFLLPGVILYGAIGVLNAISCYLVFTREPGAERVSFLAGCALLIWLVAQAAMIGASPVLQLGCASLAVVMVLYALSLARTPQLRQPARQLS
jgi:hypothetical protein